MHIQQHYYSTIYNTPRVVENS